jgi:ABC-2 type transport system ATP-binding protein
MDLVQRMCDHVALITNGRVVVAGTVDEVRGDSTLEDRFVELVGGRRVGEGPEWLRRS